MGIEAWEIHKTLMLKGMQGLLTPEGGGQLDTNILVK